MELIPKNNQKNIRMEVNLGAAIPVFSRAPKGDNKQKTFSGVVQVGEEDGSLKSIEVETRSDAGPLSPRDYSVLVALIDLAYDDINKTGDVIERNGTGAYRLNVSYIEICRKLGLDENSISHVRNSLKKIKSQSMRIKNFAYDANTNTVRRIDEETSLILKMRKYFVKDGRSPDNTYGGIHIDLDAFIVDSMLTENVSVMNRKVFIELTASIRRIYSFLESKKTILGDQFTFKLSELCKLIGKEPSYKSKEKILEQFAKISKHVDIRYHFSKDKGTMDWSVLIKFENNQKLEKEKSFFEYIKESYPSRLLNELELDEYLIENHVNDLKKSYARSKEVTHYLFRDKKICAGEFAIDILLHRIYHQQSHVKHFKAYAKKIIESMVDDTFELPDKYRLFVKDRSEKKQTRILEKTIISENERIDKLEQEEEKQLKENFDAFYERFVKPDTKLQKFLQDEAKDELHRTCHICSYVNEEISPECSECGSKDFIHEGVMFYESNYLVNKVNQIAWKMFQDGTLLDLISETGLSDSSTKKLPNRQSVENYSLFDINEKNWEDKLTDATTFKM